MKHRIPLFQRFLRGVLLVVMSAQFFFGVPIALSFVGCAAQQIDAPSPSSPSSPMTLQSLRERNPKALATSICVLPNKLPPRTKFFLADAKRKTFVSDQNRDAFNQFLPFADTIFELNPFARSSSAALLGKALNLSCPDSFTVLRSPEDIENGAPAEQTMVRISTDVFRELSGMVEQSCKAAALERTAPRYIGQQSGKAGPIFTGVANAGFQARVGQLQGIERIPEPEPSGPKSLARLLMDTSQGQTAQT